MHMMLIQDLSERGENDPSVNVVSSQGNVKNSPPGLKRLLLNRACHIVDESFQPLEAPLGYWGRDLVLKAFQLTLQEVHTLGGRQTGEMLAWDTGALS